MTLKTLEETQLFYDSLNINRVSSIDRAGLKAQRATYGPRAVVCRCLDQSSKGLWQSGRRNNNHVDCWASRRGLHLPTPPTFSFPFCHFVCGEKKWLDCSSVCKHATDEKRWVKWFSVGKDQSYNFAKLSFISRFLLLPQSRCVQKKITVVFNLNVFWFKQPPLVTAEFEKN